MIIETIIEYLIYLYFLKIIFNNIDLSLALLFLIIFIKYIHKNIYVLKQQIISHNFDLLLLKPVNPIILLFKNGINLIDCIIGLLIIIFLCLKLPVIILIIISTLIILVSFYFIILSATLFLPNKLSIEKIFPLIIITFISFSISNKSFLGLISLPASLSTFLFSIALLFLSIKLWNYSLKKYL